MNTLKPTRSQYLTKEDWEDAMVIWYKDQIKPEDVVIDNFNPTVTVTYKPLSMNVTVKEHRSQHRNREDALQVIAEELWKLDIEPTEMIP